MRKVIGENVRQARLVRGLTQAGLAEVSGFSQQYISGLEAGQRNPTAISLYELSQALSVEVHLLMIDHGDAEWLGYQKPILG